MIEYKLSNGITIPSVGIGTFLLEPPDAENSVREALKMGYRLIDTAAMYCNERAVGRGIRSSGVPREEIFVSTKIWPTEYENPHAVEDCLERLGLDHVELMFLHHACKDYIAGYRLLEKAYQEGKIKAIGLSNFEGEPLQKILKIAKILPHVNQVECHPLFPQEELRKVSDPLGMKIMSWFPLGGVKNKALLLENPLIKEIAEKHHKSIAQIILRWHVQMGFIVIPGSKNVSHIKDNISLFDFALDEIDMAKMASLNRHEMIHPRTEEALARYAALYPKYETE